MPDLTEFADVPLPAERVWDVVGDFDDIHKWAPAITGQTNEDTAEGRVRTIPIGGREVRELKAASSQFSYTYTILGRPAEAEYRSTIAVIPLDASTTRIELILHVTDPESTEEALVERYTKFLQGNMTAMRRSIGA